MKLLFITIILFTTTLCKAQFKGTYSIEDSTKAMSASLNIFQDSMFNMLFLDDFNYIFGKWKPVGANKIRLTEEKLNTEPLLVFGYKSDIKSDSIRFYFRDCEEGKTEVAFVADTLQKPIFTTITESEHIVMQPKGKYHYLKMIDNRQGQKKIYSFLLFDYSNFLIDFDAHATDKLYTIDIEKKGSAYFVGNTEINKDLDNNDGQITLFKEWLQYKTNMVTTGNHDGHNGDGYDTQRIWCDKIETVKNE